MAKTRIKNIIFHWSASAPTTTVDNIRTWHTQKGWRDIGYHRIILHPAALGGEDEVKHWYDLVKQGRSLDMDMFISDLEVGAHAYGHNVNTVGVCVVGGPGYNLHPIQETAIIQTAKVLTERFGLWRRDVICHRDVYNTQCPGNQIYNVVKKFKGGRI